MDADYGLIEAVIMVTKGELLRLQRHPELFPSEDIREKFWHNVRITCNSLVKNIMPGQEARDHEHEISRCLRKKEAFKSCRWLQPKSCSQILKNIEPSSVILQQ